MEENSPKQIYNELAITHRDQTIPVKRLIDTNIAIERIRRRVNKCIYLNKYCFMKLKGTEIPRLNALLLALYDDYLLHKDNKEYIGLKQETLADCYLPFNKDKNGRDGMVRQFAWFLIPQFVYVRSIGLERQSRKYRLNENGVKLVELLIEDAKKREIRENDPNYKKPEKKVIQKEVIEEEEEDEQLPDGL